MESTVNTRSPLLSCALTEAGIVTGLALLLIACPRGLEPPTEGKAGREVGKSAADAGQVTISGRLGKFDGYPCSECHDKLNRTKASATAEPTWPLAGKHRNLTFAHMKTIRCYNCHDRQNIDRLRLLSGDSISFDASFELCGQCHAAKLQDWRYGAHGKVVGSWSGVRQRYNCAQCHNPHAPRVKTTQALPGPAFPPRGIPKTGGGH